MPNAFYSPTNKVNGGALFASWNSKEGSVYFRVLKQIANNPDKKGNFDGKNPLNIKLSQDEAADFVRAVRTNGESKFYHKFDSAVTTGSFKHYVIPAKDTFPARSGFGFSVKKTQDGKETEIKVGFTLASAERLSLFLQNALVHIFDAEYSQDLKDNKEYAEKRSAAKPTTPTSESDGPPQGPDF